MIARIILTSLLSIPILAYIMFVWWGEAKILQVPFGEDTSGFLIIGGIMFFGFPLLIIYCSLTLITYFLLMHNKKAAKRTGVYALALMIILLVGGKIFTGNSQEGFILPMHLVERIQCLGNETDICIWRKAMWSNDPNLCEKLTYDRWGKKRECAEKAMKEKSFLF